MKPVIWCVAAAVFLSLGIEADAQVPAPPFVKGVKAGSDVLLEWEDDPAATSFNVYRTDDLLVPPTLHATVTESFFLDAGAVPGPPANPPRYFYWVRGNSAMGEGPSSNVAYKLNYDLKTGGKNTLALPYLYYPDGDIANEEQAAMDLCADLNSGDCFVVTVVELLRAGSVLAPRVHGCMLPFNVFDLRPGTFYFVNAESDCTADIVGAHNNEYSLGGSLGLTLTEGYNVVSVPYSVMARSPTELCEHLAADNPGGELSHIVRVVPWSGGIQSQPCSAPVDLFSLEPGEGYFFYYKAPPDEWLVQWRTH